MVSPRTHTRTRNHFNNVLQRRSLSIKYANLCTFAQNAKCASPANVHIHRVQEKRYI